MGFTFVREPGKSERYQYIHRLEYEPAEFKALNDEDRYWVNHNGNIVRYWHTRTKIAAEKSPELQAFRQRAYEALAAQSERQDVDAAVAKAKEAFPQLIALVRKPEWAILKEDVELVDDAVELQSMYMKLAPRGADQAPVKPPLNEFFPMVGEMQAYNEDADRAPARQPDPAETKKAQEMMKQFEAKTRKEYEEKMKKPSEPPKK